MVRRSQIAGRYGPIQGTPAERKQDVRSSQRAHLLRQPPPANCRIAPQPCYPAKAVRDDRRRFSAMNERSESMSASISRQTLEKLLDGSSDSSSM